MAIIDDSSRYVNYFGFAVSELLMQTSEGTAVLYLPKSKLFGKVSVIKSGITNSKKVWSSFLYPLQILHSAIIDNVNITHIQLEINTFGHPITLLLLPFLLGGLKLAKIKIVVTLHAVFPRSQMSRGAPSFVSSKLMKVIVLASLFLLYRLIGKYSSSIIVHSEPFKKWLVDYGINPKKVHVIHHGVATRTSGFSSRITQLSTKNNCSKIILCFGVLSPRKGLENLIRAFKIVNAKHPEATLVLAGCEPIYYRGYKDKLITLSKCLLIENKVIFNGSVPENKIGLLFSEADVIVLPYTFSVSASGPLTIALQYAKPIIATNTPFFRSELENGEDAILVQTDNYADLASAIITVLDNKQLSDKLSQGAKRLAEALSWNRIAENTIKQYMLAQ